MLARARDRLHGGEINLIGDWIYERISYGGRPAADPPSGTPLLELGAASGLGDRRASTRTIRRASI